MPQHACRACRTRTLLLAQSALRAVSASQDSQAQSPEHARTALWARTRIVSGLALARSVCRTPPQCLDLLRQMLANVTLDSLRIKAPAPNVRLARGMAADWAGRAHVLLCRLPRRQWARARVGGSPRAAAGAACRTRTPPVFAAARPATSHQRARGVTGHLQRSRGCREGPAQRASSARVACTA